MANISGWDAEKMFKLYLLDFLVKRNMYETAEMFAKEAEIDLSLPVIDSPVGFLLEWWGAFFDIYFSRQIAEEVATEESGNKGKQIAEPQSEAHDQQSRVPSSEIARLFSQLEANPVAPKMLDFEQLARNTGGFASSSPFPASVFPVLNSASGSSSCNNDPQLLLPTQEKKRFNMGSKDNDLNFGAMKAMFGLPGSTNVGTENAMNSTTLQGWPLLGAGQLSPHMGQQVIPSYLQQLNHQSQIQLPAANSDQELLVQPMDCTPGRGSLITSLPGSSSDPITRNQMHLQNIPDGSFGQVSGSSDLSLHRLLLDFWGIK